MRLAKWVFLLAGFSGVVMIAPLYFENRFFEDFPPPINRPEFYYGFAGLCLAWQVMFIVIGFDPVRFRLAMLPSMLEKASFAAVIPILYAVGRVTPIWLCFALMDATWFVLFVIAFLKTPKALPLQQQVMQLTSEQLSAAVTAAANQTLNNAAAQIKHCLGQLNDQQVWWRPSDSMNSIGNLILHLCGNVRQWIVAGIGGEPDVRQRPKEFSERGPISKSELLRRLDQVLAEAHEALKKAAGQDLLRKRIVQGFDMTGMETIFDSVPHFKGHTQEIVHMTRCLLGDAYQFAWAPATPQEGATQ